MENKETLEEAADRIVIESNIPYDFSKELLKIAQWQEERMYSKQDLEKAYNLGVQAMDECGVYSRAMCDWDKIKKQFNK